MKRLSLNKISLGMIAAVLAALPEAHALTLDWAGYFRADHNHIRNFQGESRKSTTFSSVYMKLKPSVLVNDNVIVRSEWNVGDPVAGFFGRSVPRTDRNNFLSSGKDGFPISVARLWLDVHTDFGTLQVGRAPFGWGLGAIFNSGDRPFDRFQSTSDTIRLVSKFGYLSLMPLYAKNAMGRSLGGARNPINDALLEGSDDVTDYGISLKYDNPEEDLEAGVLYYKRSSGDSQNSYYNPAGATAFSATRANGMKLTLIDLYAKKSWHRFEIGAEVPLFLKSEIGDVNGVGTRNEFSATAVALEAALKYDTWKHMLKLGTVPGQNSVATRDKSFSALSFNRAYKLGQILFNYNLGAFGPANPDPVPATPNAGDSVVSPYDASISNAKYVMLATEKRWEQWGLNLGLVWAQANATAQPGMFAYNHRTGTWYSSTGTQGKNMGIEVDLGTRYDWDDKISFGADLGVLFPGDYLKFTDNAVGTGFNKKVLAVSFSASTVF